MFFNFIIFTDHHAPLFKREHDYYPYNTLTVDYAMQYWHQKGTWQYRDSPDSTVFGEILNGVN